MRSAKPSSCIACILKGMSRVDSFRGHCSFHGAGSGYSESLKSRRYAITEEARVLWNETLNFCIVRLKGVPGDCRAKKVSMFAKR